MQTDEEGRCQQWLLGHEKMEDDMLLGHKAETLVVLKHTDGGGNMTGTSTTIQTRDGCALSRQAQNISGISSTASLTLRY